MVETVLLYLLLWIMFLVYVAPYVLGYVVLGLIVPFTIIEVFLRLFEAMEHKKATLIFARGWQIIDWSKDERRWVTRLLWLLWPVLLFVVTLGTVTYFLFAWFPEVALFRNKKPVLGK